MKYLIILVIISCCPLVEGLTKRLPVGVAEDVSSNDFEETTIASRTSGCRIVTRRYLGKNRTLQGTWRQELYFSAQPLLLVERKPVSRMLATTVWPLPPTNRVVQIDFDTDAQIDSYLIFVGENMTDILVTTSDGMLRHATRDEYEARWEAFNPADRGFKPKEIRRLIE